MQPTGIQKIIQWPAVGVSKEQRVQDDVGIQNDAQWRIERRDG